MRLRSIQTISWNFATMSCGGKARKEGILGGRPLAEAPFMSCSLWCESPLPPRTVGEVVGVSSSPSKVYVAPMGERGREPVAGDRARLWERLKSRRERKGDVFFSLLGRCGTWRGECAETGSGVVLPELCVPSVIMVGREGEAFLLFRWKPDRKRSIVKAGRRCDSVKVMIEWLFLRLSGGRWWVGRGGMRLPMTALLGRDRGVAIQDTGREKRLWSGKERLKRTSLREKYLSGGQGPAMCGQFVSVSVDATGGEWTGADWSGLGAKEGHKGMNVLRSRARAAVLRSMQGQSKGFFSSVGR